MCLKVNPVILQQSVLQQSFCSISFYLLFYFWNTVPSVWLSASQKVVQFIWLFAFLDNMIQEKIQYYFKMVYHVNYKLYWSLLYITYTVYIFNFIWTPFSCALRNCMAFLLVYYALNIMTCSKMKFTIKNVINKDYFYISFK